LIRLRGEAIAMGNWFLTGCMNIPIMQQNRVRAIGPLSDHQVATSLGSATILSGGAISEWSGVVAAVFSALETNRGNLSNGSRL